MIALFMNYLPQHLPADALKIAGNQPVTWSDVPVFHPASQYQSADISSLVQRKVGTPGWKFRDSLAIVVDATTGRRAIASPDHHRAAGTARRSCNYKYSCKKAADICACCVLSPVRVEAHAFILCFLLCCVACFAERPSKNN